MGAETTIHPNYNIFAFGANKVSPFVSKLHDMVDDPKRRDHVRWAKDGRSFVITDEEKFERNLAGVLPGLSFTANMGNFHRELANYGFRKPDAHELEFEHEGFVRGADDEELAGVRRRENYGRYRKDASGAGHVIKGHLST